MNNLINFNLKEKLDQFPSKIKEIAFFMIKSLSNGDRSEVNVADELERKIDRLVLEEEKNETN